MLKFSTVYSKIKAFIVLAGIIFLVLSLVLGFYKTRLENQIASTAEIHFKHEITSLLDLNSQSMINTVNDYVYWDDLVTAIEKKDIHWFDTGITFVTASIFDYYAVFNPKFEIISQVTGKKIHHEIKIPEELLENLKQRRTAHFYLTTPDGLMEVCAGSIHPSDDLEQKKTQPFGYLVIMKKWDQNSISHLASIVGSEIEVKTTPDSGNIGRSSMIQANIVLKSWDGKPIASLVSKRDLKLNFNATRYIFYIIVVFVLLLLILFYFQSRMWIYKPLKLVTDVLKTDNQESIEQLKKTPAEYGRIGVLFEAFVTQKQELIEAKEKAEESDRLKSAFLANMSHEIRTPMNGILGFAEILKAPDLTGEQQQEYISTMEKCGVRMLNIIDDIIDLSKIESGHINVSVSEINVNEKIKDIYTFFKSEAEQKGLQMYYKNALPDKEAIIKTDRNKLFAILTNLVKNAIKFTKTGSIEIGYSSTLRPAQSGAGSPTVTFFVKDTGIGIRQEQKEFIFERFRQVGESLSRDYQGAGLGLAISKAYVEILGGKIWVESENGNGSTFYFTIPYTNSLSIPESFSNSPFNFNA